MVDAQRLKVEVQKLYTNINQSTHMLPHKWPTKSIQFHAKLHVGIYQIKFKAVS